MNDLSLWLRRSKITWPFVRKLISISNFQTCWKMTVVAIEFNFRKSEINSDFTGFG